MEPLKAATASKTPVGIQFAQVAWVTKDIKAAEKFFQDVIGVSNFIKIENMHAQEFNATYYGEPAEFEWHVYITYSGGSFIELIQPVSGRSIFQDYLEKNPAGGVQHIAYDIPVADFDKIVSDLTGKGYPLITTLDMPVAKIAFFDTYQEIGVVTEITGITEEGAEFVQKLKEGKI